MRVTTTVRTTVFVAALSTGLFSVSDAAILAVGVTPANAKEFYTRKRVNGRWITGHFGRRHSAAQRKTEANARPGVDRKLLAAPRPDGSSSRSARTTEPVIKPEPMTSVGAAPVGSPTTETGVVGPLTTDERLLKLQAALQAHARSLAAKFESASASQSINGAASQEPRSVSFDFQSGVKTTVFSDGARGEEPFETGSIKGLASARSVGVPGGKQALAAPAWTE